MEVRSRSRSTTPNRSYETTYRREFISRRSPSTIESAPFGQRFLIGSPFQLNDPIEDTMYTMHFSKPKNIINELDCGQIPNWCRRSQSSCELPVPDEMKQALKNQIDSTHRVDYTGAPQNLQIQLAYERKRPYWRHRAKHTLDSEYRYSFPTHPKTAFHFGGRYSFSSKKPAESIVPQALPRWKNQSLHSIYTNDIAQKSPTDLFMKIFVDSLNGPMNS